MKSLRFERLPAWLIGLAAALYFAAGLPACGGEGGAGGTESSSDGSTIESGQGDTGSLEGGGGQDGTGGSAGEGGQLGDGQSGGEAAEDAAAEPDGTSAGDASAPVADVVEPREDTSAAVDVGPLVDWCEVDEESFSFFVTSMAALWALSGDELSNLQGGFGGNFGGLAGADGICQTIGAATGHGHKTWRAFLSATNDGDGNAVHAIERVGEGPWYDANGRLVAENVQGLLQTRPAGDPETVDDLPDECGVPLSLLGDVHDIATGSNSQGKLHSTDPESTCHDWTTSDGSVGSSGGGGGGPGGGPGGGGGDETKRVMCGHSFPREGFGGGGGGGKHWISDHPVRGCGKGATLIQNGPGTGTCIGCAGGYGALYCFAL